MDDIRVDKHPILGDRSMGTRVRIFVDGEPIEAEEGEKPVNYAKLLRLQALDVARMGEVFAEEIIAAEKKADDEFIEWIGDR